VLYVTADTAVYRIQMATKGAEFHGPVQIGSQR